MGLCDNLKKATGLGLDAGGAYNRAYEKAVLLGEDHYSEAVGLFEKAADKADDEDEPELADRARANAALYSFVCKGGLEPLRSLQELLPRIPEMEQLGSQNDMMPTAPLCAEITARLAESRISELSSASALAQAHDEAAAAFKGIFNNDLMTYRLHASDQHVDKASSRFFFHTGMAEWHRAVSSIESDPHLASEHMAKALGGFKNAQDTAWIARADEWLARGRFRRSCWMCHREFQGDGIHFHATSAEVAPYVVKRVQELGQDSSAVDFDRAQIVLCTPCHSAVYRMAESVAEERAAALRAELASALAERDAAIKALASRLSKVESLAHTH